MLVTAGPIPRRWRRLFTSASSKASLCLLWKRFWISNILTFWRLEIGAGYFQSVLTCILGRGSRELPILQAVKSGYLLAGGNPRQIVFVNSLKAVNWQMRVGGFLPRRLGLVSLGRFLAAAGARRAYPKLADIVAATKAKYGAADSFHPASFLSRQE